MKKINFCKFHGFSNDYIVFEAESLSEIKDKSDFAIKVCNRHKGIGGDGIAILKRLDPAQADYYCEIINPDGSIAANGGGAHNRLFSGRGEDIDPPSVD